MKHVVILNEFSLFGIVVSRIRKRDNFLLQIAPIFPFFHRILNALAHKFLRAGWLRDIAELDEVAAEAHTRMPLFPCSDWYGRSEGMIVNQLGLDRLRPDPAFDFAARKQAVNFGAEQLRTIHFIHEMNRDAPDIRIKLHGNARYLADLYGLLSEFPDRTCFVPSRYPRRLINACLTVLAALRTLAHVVRFTKFKPARPRKIFFGIDAIDNLERMIPAVNDLLDDVSRQGLYVFRNRQSYSALREGLSAYPVSPYPDGQFAFRQFLWVCSRSIGDAVKLLWRFGATDSRLFLQIVKLSVFRTYFEGMLNKYDMTYFLARDEYNGEHVIRSQELRRRGTVSLGLLNGVNVFGVDSVFRFVDHDITYVFSPGSYLKHNRENWRQPLDVRQIGAIGLSRAEIREMTAREKEPDIVCFAKTYCDRTDFLNQVFKLGRSLPDRKVFVSLKKSATRLGGGDEFFGHMENAPANVTLVDDPSFQLIKRCRYVLSGESSIISEAINLGSMAFFLDTYAKDEVYIYRDYPDLSYGDGDLIVDRIKSIEDGTWRYPVEQFADLADLSGWISFDVIRRDIGLDPLDPPILWDAWSDKPIVTA